MPCYMGPAPAPAAVRRSRRLAAKPAVNYYEAPVRMRRELLATAANMKKMAQGRYKKSYDESIHKNLATMFFHGIAWARDEEGNTKKLAH